MDTQHGVKVLKSGSFGSNSIESPADEEFEYIMRDTPKAERRWTVAWAIRPNPRKPATHEGLCKSEDRGIGEDLAGVGPLTMDS